MPKKRNAKRKDGRIPVQVYLGKIDGKRKYKTVYGRTQKEANEKALEVKLQIKKGIDVTAEQDTFGQWAERWLKLKSGSVSASQYNSYKSAISHLNDSLRNVPLTKIRTCDIQEVIFRLAEYNENSKKPAARRTLLLVRSAVSQVFGLAINNRVIDYNPANAVKIPTDAPSEHRRALTEKEQQWIIDTPHRAQRAAMIMMYAGLRRGELIPLTWGDIDLHNGTISVNKSVEMIGAKARLKSTAKTPCSIRVIDIPQKLIDFLKKQKPANAKSTDLVCTAANGKMLTKTSWRTMWDSYLAVLNIKYGDFTCYCKATKQKWPTSVHRPKKLPMMIPHFTAHWLRHTFATLLYMAGVDVLTAKEQLEHSDIKTTLGIYTHLDKKFKRRSMDKLNRYLNASHMQVIEGGKSSKQAG
ncbi:MAG TPA: site-specific integrase [Ruminococcaceae bacterium]|jgi:integrase|nr:site-specific integrase [Oscillospiraceae bacterium]